MRKQTHSGEAVEQSRIMSWSWSWSLHRLMRCDRQGSDPTRYMGYSQHGHEFALIHSTPHCILHSDCTYLSEHDAFMNKMRPHHDRLRYVRFTGVFVPLTKSRTAYESFANSDSTFLTLSAAVDFLSVRVPARISVCTRTQPLLWRS